MYSALIILLLVLFLAPWLALYIFGKGDLQRYLEFPPVALYIVHAPYEELVFYGLLIALVLFFSIFIKRLWIRRHVALRMPKPTHSAFPFWGYLSFVVVVLSWVIAWTRFEIFSLIQPHTFILLWLGFVFMVNALCLKVHATCPMFSNPRAFFILFPISAVFWWIFEYINRFIQNWTYQEVSHFSTMEYFILASTSFSFVLPALLSVRAFIDKNRYVDAAFKEWYRLEIFSNKKFLLAILLGSSFVYLILPLFPNELFWFVWLATPLIYISLVGLMGGKTFFNDLYDGNWSSIVYWSISGLICGFFWEMWNFYSLSRWVYHVPYVSNFYIFEMPLAGYAGYVPFGTFCGLMIELFNNSMSPATTSPLPRKAILNL